MGIHFFSSQVTVAADFVWPLVWFQLKSCWSTEEKSHLQFGWPGGEQTNCKM